MIEIPPPFANTRPIGPIPEGEQVSLLRHEWHGAEGLAEDVRRYGIWMREEAKTRIGHLYPQAEITAEMAQGRPDLLPYVGKKLTVIAWLWARTVKSPHPDFSHVEVPLVSSFVLSKKKGHEAYVQPIIEGNTYRFEVRVGIPPKDAENGTKIRRGSNFYDLMTKTPIDGEYIKAEGMAHRFGQRLMAIVCDSKKGRIYLTPNDVSALNVKPGWKPDTSLPNDIRNFWTVNYGLNKYSDLFTPRQLVALNTFSDLVQEAREKAIVDAIAAGMPDDGIRLCHGGKGATAYGDALAVYLGFGVSRLSDILNALCRWEVSKTQVRNLFGRQAIPMIWDFAENNVFGEAAGDYLTSLSSIIKVIESWCTSKLTMGYAHQSDAQTQTISQNKVVSTDPPYYDNIGYANLSDSVCMGIVHNSRTMYAVAVVIMCGF